MREGTLFFLVLGALAPLASARCQWAVMNNAKDTYLYAISSGELEEGFEAPSVKYIENNVPVDIKKGVLSKRLKIDHHRTLFDQDECATYTELISTDSANPYVIGTQIRYNNTGAGVGDASISVYSVDSVVTTTGDWLFNATKTLSYIQQENWGVIPLDSRDSRETLKKAADAYLDLWGNPNATVPWGTPCARLEGSAYTGRGEPTDSCAVGIPGGSQPPVTDRRYVMDETQGSINVLCKFGAMRNGAADSHEFRLEGGKLRYVHTMTVMRNTTGLT